MHLKKEEFEEMMLCLEKSYNHPHYSFPQYYPHVWRKDTIQYKNRIIAKERNKIVSHVGIFPLTAVVENTQIKMGGIGGVATLPEFRRRGHMTRLMDYCIQKMRDDGYPISTLWGDRERYENFGYEVAGEEVIFKFSKRSLKRNVELFPVNVTRLEEKKGLIEKIIFIHKNEPLHIKRKKRDYALIFAKPNLITLLAEKKGRFAYVSFYSPSPSPLKTLTECGGNPRVLFSLIYAVLEKWKTESVEIPFSCYPTKMFFSLLEASSSWYIRPLGLIKILNLRETINSYSSIIEKRAQKLGLKGTLTLGIKGKKEKIMFCLNSGSSLKEEISLSEREMVRLLFASPCLVDIERPSSLLYLLFPLPLYVGPLDCV